MSNPQQALETYLGISCQNGAAHVFRAATELGIFEALAEGQKEAPQVAEACQASVEPVRLMLDVLCSLTVIEKYGDDYALAPVMHLVTERDRFMGDEYWKQLADRARREQGAATNGMPPSEERDAAFRTTTASTQWIHTPAALTVAKTLEIGTKRRQLSILDLGATTGVWSLTMLHHDRASRATVIDSTEVLATAARMADDIGVADRMEAIAGDYRTAELLPGHYDLVVAANLLHLEKEEGCNRLLKRSYDALKPGGELVVVDLFEGQIEGDLYRTLFALELFLRTSAGRLRTIVDVEQLVVAAGFDSPTFALIPDPPAARGVLLARK